MKDFLIIGQGAAGSFLAWELLKRDKQITILDDDHRQSSSIISAGIINPITGKRFAITNDFDQFYTHAEKIYLELATKFDQQFFEALPILRVFQNASEHDHWYRKVELNQAQQYCRSTNSPGTFHPAINDPLGSVLIQKSGFCYTSRILNTLKEYFQNNKILVRQRFSYDDLSVQNNAVSYGGESFKTVIFCEGYQAQWNPWFDWIPYNSVKGEILRVSIHGMELPNVIINRGKWCVPVGQGQWMAGSSYIWDRLDCEPTPEASTQIINGLNRCFDNGLCIEEHHAGVRPVVLDQKPVMGRHPKFANLAIFNGLGSKGFLMAPLYAVILAEHLSTQSVIGPEVSLSRFDTNLVSQ